MSAASIVRRLRAALRSPEGGRAAKALAVAASIATVLAIELGLAMGHWLASPGPAIKRRSLRGDWIAAPGDPSYAGYFRRHVVLPGPVKHAWMVVAPFQAYEICVNRNPCGRVYLWRPTRPFQTGSNEPGQLLNSSPAALALNFPREYQWSSHRNDWLPSVHDITPHLKPGDNVIAVEIESRQAPAMVKIEGEILLWSGDRIRIDSDAGWLAEPVPPFDPRYDWTEPRYNDPRLAFGGRTGAGWPHHARPPLPIVRSRGDDHTLHRPLGARRPGPLRRPGLVLGDLGPTRDTRRRLDPPRREPQLRPLPQRSPRHPRPHRQPRPRLGRLDPRRAAWCRSAGRARTARPRRGGLAVRRRPVRGATPRRPQSARLQAARKHDERDPRQGEGNDPE
ncbi:MAG: hypothetical protein U0800_09530 [Isosphaeraceae bacterium]